MLPSKYLLMCLEITLIIKQLTTYNRGKWKFPTMHQFMFSNTPSAEQLKTCITFKWILTT